MQNEVVEFLVKLVQRESVTPNECGIYDLVKEKLSDFKVIEQEVCGVKNLFAYKDFGVESSVDSNVDSSLDSKRESKKVHLCFAGHIDVVPSGEGWEYPPFSGTIKDGVIFGRGVQDMKGGVASFIYALREIREFDGILSVLLTSDEEGDGIYGTKIMLEELQKRDLLPDYAIVAEPTCENKLGDTIKVGRRGSINGVLNLYGIQGHAAYPSKCKNPIEIIAPLLPQIAGVFLDGGDSCFDRSKLVITDIRAGMEVCNVTPDKLKLMFNVRNSPHTDADSIRDFIRRIFDGVDYDLELKQSSFPFITESRELIEPLCRVIEDSLNVRPTLSTSGGTSDARYFSAFGVSVVEFGLINDRIHAINECVKIDDVIRLKEIFATFIAKFGRF